MLTELIHAPLAPPMPKGFRSPGVHLSGIIRQIAVANKILKPDQVDDLGLVEAGSNEDWWKRLDPGSRLRIAMGLAWEEWYIPQLPEVVDHPGEMCVDGIYMTHDGESIDTILSECRRLSVMACHEVKATYKSIKTVGNLETQWMWLAQTKGYCRGLGTRIAYLHVLFVCGDYSYPITPVLKVWKITFTPEEIEDNWELMKDVYRHYQQQEREDLMRDTQ